MHGPLNVKIRQQSVMHISTCKAFKDKGLMQLMRCTIMIFCSKEEWDKKCTHFSEMWGHIVSEEVLTFWSKYVASNFKIEERLPDYAVSYPRWLQCWYQELKKYKLHSHISHYISECAKIKVKWSIAKWIPMNESYTEVSETSLCT